MLWTPLKWPVSSRATWYDMLSALLLSLVFHSGIFLLIIIGPVGRSLGMLLKNLNAWKNVLMLGEVHECYMEKRLISRGGLREESECWEKCLNATWRSV